MTEGLTPINPEQTAWVESGDQVVFLDLGRDRYFALSAPYNASFRAAIESGELVAWHVPECLPTPGTWSGPYSDPPAAPNARPDIAGIAATLWIERRVERRMKSMPFGQLLRDVRSTVEKRVAGVAGDRGESLAGIVADSENARLIRSAPDRCVPRSLALVLRCASRGIRAHAVIGVRTRPFAAHCWAQHGGVVLSDPLETVASFSPILVI